MRIKLDENLPVRAAQRLREMGHEVDTVLDEGLGGPVDTSVPGLTPDAEMKKQPLDKDALRALPPDVLGKLQKAVIAARYDEIIEIVEVIRIAEPEVATGLRRMADRFDYDGMRDLLCR